MSKPSYYAVIPANVRYSSLPPLAKLLFGEIAALTNNDNFECWASNEYFAMLYDVQELTIKRLIKALKLAGFIRVRFENNRRLLSIVEGIKNDTPRVSKKIPRSRLHYNVSIQKSINSQIDHEKGF